MPAKNSCFTGYLTDKKVFGTIIIRQFPHKYTVQRNQNSRTAIT